VSGTPAMGQISYSVIAIGANSIWDWGGGG